MITMKRFQMILLALAWGALNISAQDFQITCFSFGSGGSSTNSGYTVTGKAEMGASTLSGGGFTGTSGSIAGIVVLQTPRAPEIVVTRNGNNLTLTWNTSDSNWVLESSSVVGFAANWTTANENITTTNSTHSAQISSPSGIRYYRLRRNTGN